MLTPVYSGRIPGTYYTVALCKGIRSPANTRPVIVFGLKGASGTGVANTPTLCTSPEDARTQGGSGYGLHLAAAAVFRGGPTAVVYTCVVEVDAATVVPKVIAFAGACTVAGTLQVQVGRTIFDIAVDVADTGDDVGTAVAAALDAATGTQGDAPATATFASPNLSLSPKDAGIDGAYVRYAFRNIPTGITIAAGSVDIESTCTAGLTGALYSAAFAAAFGDGMPSYDFVVPAATDTAYLTTATTGLKDRITTAAGATIMRQMNAVIGSNADLATATTASASFDDGGTDWDEPGWRFQVIWGKLQFALPWELAGTECGIRATKTAVNRNANWSGKRGAKMPGIFPVSLTTNYPTTAEIEAALTAGVTPLRYERNEIGFQYGLVTIVRPITCKFSSGGAVDLRASDVNIPDVAQAVAVGMNTYLADKYNSCTISDDDEDGNPPADLPEDCVTPSLMKSTAIARYKSFYCDRLGWCEKSYTNDAGELTDVAELFVCERDTADPTATNMRHPILVRRWHMRSGFAFEEFGAG